MRRRRKSEFGGAAGAVGRRPGTPGRPLPARPQASPAATPAPEANEEDGVPERDMRLGQLLLESKACGADHLDQCLRVQEQMVAMGAEAIPRLGELLVRRGFASIAQVEQALEVQESLGRTCAGCGEFSPALLLDMGDGRHCPRCGATFGTRARVVVVPAGDESDAVPAVAPALKPHGVPDPIPPELKQLGKYELLKELGRGSMGVVYEALDPSLNRRVAIKLLHPHVGKSSQEVQQFAKEAQLSAALPKHPNIVTVYEAGLLGERHFIAMERIEGVPLSSWRRKGSVAVRQQIRILRDVALAVHHAHENGILHCDLKPQNVMIDERKKPYVTDFGLARRPGRDTRVEMADGMTAGTPAYMSPEQARGLPQLDRRTDVYSLGTMLYEVLTGRIPFQAKTAEELLRKTVHDPVRPPSGVARSLASIDPRKTLDHVCLKALAKKPSSRYATARALADDLTRWLRGEAVQGRPRRRAPRPAWIRIAVAAAIVVAGVVVLRAWKDDGDPEAAKPDPLLQARRELERARLELEAKAKADAEALQAERRKVAELQEQARARPGQIAAPAGAFDPVEWLVAGPFDNRGIDEVLAPEIAINTAAPMTGKTAPIRWRRVSPELRVAGGGRAAVFDFNRLFSPNTLTVAYAAVHVKAPMSTDALLLVGSDDGVKVWANGSVIHRHDMGRGLKVDDDEVAFRLLKGWNTLLFKVTQRNQGWGLSARITDSSRRPMDGLEYDPLGDLPQTLPQAMPGH